MPALTTIPCQLGTIFTRPIAAICPFCSPHPTVCSVLLLQLQVSSTSLPAPLHLAVALGVHISMQLLPWATLIHLKDSNTNAVYLVDRAAALSLVPHQSFPHPTSPAIVNANIGLIPWARTNSNLIFCRLMYLSQLLKLIASKLTVQKLISK